MKKPWFRAYTDMVDDEKLRLLAFEDRWHFVALMCCKRSGLLDEGDERALLWRKIAVKLGVQVRELEEIARRLSEVGLIDEETLHPIAWETRQYESDNSTDRVRRYRERQKEKDEGNQECNGMKRFSNVSVTPPDTEYREQNSKKEKINKKKESPSSRFNPPSVDDVSAYCKRRGNAVDPEKFIDYYTANGWMVGRNKMKDWQAAVRTWEKNTRGQAEPARKRKML